MAYNPLQAPHSYSDEEFYAVIDRLKSQDALPQDSFIREVPFFHFDFISKESQIKELFQACDPNLYKALLQNIISFPTDTESSSSNGSSDLNMMTFAQICLYKVLPCPDPNCANRPREIVTHNQYKDYEYECPFYHHEKDRRRIVITNTVDEEFEYKANYYEEGRSNAEKEKYSLNYFESMFHPLYYKMFRCKREFCRSCHCCPFYHYEQEKKTWDTMFSNFIRKDRITYVKDKQKYYESTSQQVTNEESSGDLSPNNNSYNKNQRNNKYPKSPNTPNQNRNNSNLFSQNEGRNGGKSRQFVNKKWGEWSKNSVVAGRKDSNDSCGMNTDAFGGMLGNVNHPISYRAC